MMYTSTDYVRPPIDAQSRDRAKRTRRPHTGSANGLVGLAILGAASVAGVGAVYLLKAAGSSRRNRRAERTASRVVSELRRLERRAERRLKGARSDNLPAIMSGANAMLSNAGSALSQLANADWRPYYDRIPSLLERLRR